MLYNYCNNILRRWNKCKRTRRQFLGDHSEWLNQEIILPLEDPVDEIPALVGRPKTPFQSSSDRSKRRKTVKRRAMFSAPELSYAAQMSLRSAGEQDAAHVFKEAMATPIRASKMRHAWKVKQEKMGITSFTSDEALSLFVNAKLSKHQYQLLRSSAKQKNADIYPSYNNIRKVKQRCYPT